MSNKVKDGTGALYHSRASLLFVIRGTIGSLTTSLSRAQNDGVLTSIERMRINSAIVSLESIVNESSKTWSDIIKPKLLAAIEADMRENHQTISVTRPIRTNETEETQSRRTEDNSNEGEDSSRPEDNRPDEESSNSSSEDQLPGD